MSIYVHIHIYYTKNKSNSIGHIKFELSEDNFISRDINIMLNSFLNTFFRLSYDTIQRIHKMRSSWRVVGGITVPILTLSSLKKDFYLLANNYNDLILNDNYKSICKTLEYIMAAKKKNLILVNKFLIPKIKLNQHGMLLKL